MNGESKAGIEQDQVEIYVDNAYIEQLDKTESVHQKGRLIYAEGGIIHVFALDQHWYLPARFYMWIPPNMSYRLESRSTHIQLYDIYYEVKSQDLAYYKTVNVYLINDLLREMFLATKEWKGPIDKKKDYAKYIFLKAIKAILPEINPELNAFPIQHPYPQDNKLIAIAKYLNEHLDQAYTIAEIAQKFGLSTRSLSRLFKEKMGMNYIRFLRSIRMAKAMELMAEDRYSLLEIAIAVGYTDLSSFSNIFQRVTGIRPSIYMAKINAYKK